MVLDLASKPAPPLRDPGPTARPGDRQGNENEPSAPAVVRQAVVVCLGMVTAEQVEFLWPPYIPLGKLTILEGDPGVGKSWLALAIAAAVSLGVKLPGAAEARGPADVLLLSAEDGLADTIVPRLEAIGADRRRIHALTGIVTDKGERGFSLVEHLDLLEEAMAQHHPVLVMLDPLVSFLGAGVDMHRANETRAVLSPLASLAERHRAAILAVRHLTKTGRDKAIYRGQGSIDFTAAARSVLLAGEESQTGKRGIVHTKSSLAPKGPTLGYAIEDGRFYWTGASDLTASRLLAPEGQDERGALGEAEDFLQDALADGERPAPEVYKEARSVGIPDRTLERAKQHLGIRAKRRGEPGKRGGGAWFWGLPEDLGDKNDLERQDSTVENAAPLINLERKSPFGGKGLGALNPPGLPQEIGVPDPWEATP